MSVRAVTPRAVPRAVPRATPSGRTAEPQDTRDRILRLVVEAGPVSVVELADRLGLTAAGVRRHVTALEADGLVAAHRTPRPAGRRGRPARTFVATDRAQAGLGSSYADLAVEVLDHLRRRLGDAAVEELAAHRAGQLAERHRAAVDRAGDDIRARAAALAEGLAADGYAASVRPAPVTGVAGEAIQLCQGHCPIRDVATHFPQFCEAETKVFADVLGVHVQRLSTLASGGHVCTTHVPTTSHAPSAHAAAADRPVTGTGEGTR